MRRLGLDAIDLYQIHWPTDALEETEEGWATLAALQKEGKVSHTCSSNNSHALTRIESFTFIHLPFASLNPTTSRHITSQNPASLPPLP